MSKMHSILAKEKNSRWFYSIVDADTDYKKVFGFMFLFPTKKWQSMELYLISFVPYAFFSCLVLENEISKNWMMNENLKSVFEH